MVWGKSFTYFRGLWVYPTMPRGEGIFDRYSEVERKAKLLRSEWGLYLWRVLPGVGLQMGLGFRI